MTNELASKANEKDKTIVANKPIIARRQIIKLGTSLYVNLPREWLDQHKVDPNSELLILADRDIRIVNPKDRQKVEQDLYDRVTEKVEEASTDDE